MWVEKLKPMEVLLIRPVGGLLLQTRLEVSQKVKWPSRDPVMPHLKLWMEETKAWDMGVHRSTGHNGEKTQLK